MRLSKYQKNVLRAEKRKSELSGNGTFLFRNNTSGDLILPRPTKSGNVRIPANEEFVGDDYYMFMVQSNELRLVKVIEPAKKEDTAANTLNESNESKESQMNDKLITEQPPTVTDEGTVEFVEQKPKEKEEELNEDVPGTEASKQHDVLLNENPMDGIDIIN